MSDKQTKILGWLGTTLSILMYVSFIQPLVAAINCTIWVCYGFFKKNRDLPLALANLPGIIFGLIAAFTAL